MAAWFLTVTYSYCQIQSVIFRTIFQVIFIQLHLFLVILILSISTNFIPLGNCQERKKTVTGRSKCFSKEKNCTNFGKMTTNVWNSNWQSLNLLTFIIHGSLIQQLHRRLLPVTQCHVSTKIFTCKSEIQHSDYQQCMSICPRFPGNNNNNNTFIRLVHTQIEFKKRINNISVCTQLSLELK